MSPSSPHPSPVLRDTPEPSQDLAHPHVRQRLSPAAVTAFLRIANLWQLPETEARHLLGGLSPATWSALQRNPADHPLPPETLTRISLLIGIFKALNILFSQHLADRWINLPNRNPIFRGATPLAHILSGGLPSMIETRRLLDSRRGGQ